jgi:hypothetical protein
MTFNGKYVSLCGRFFYLSAAITFRPWSVMKTLISRQGASEEDSGHKYQKPYKSNNKIYLEGNSNPTINILVV